MSGFHRISKSVKGIEGRRAQTKMTSESMMRLISNLLLQLALFGQAQFSSSYHQPWSSMASAASRAMPGSGRRKINWFRPFGWRYYPGRRGSVTLWGLGHHEGRGRLKPVLSGPWADAKLTFVICHLARLFNDLRDGKPSRGKSDRKKIRGENCYDQVKEELDRWCSARGFAGEWQCRPGVKSAVQRQGWLERLKPGQGSEAGEVREGERSKGPARL